MRLNNHFHFAIDFKVFLKKEWRECVREELNSESTGSHGTITVFYEKILSQIIFPKFT